jgi:hypothetical protein
MQTFLNVCPEIITDTYGHEQFYIFFFLMPIHQLTTLILREFDFKLPGISLSTS